MTTTALAPVREISQRERHTVIIAATVAAVLGSRARIRRISETRGEEPTAWVKQGRADIHALHGLFGLQMRPMPVVRRGKR